MPRRAPGRFDTGQLFSILFDPALLAAIETPEPLVGPDWDTASLVDGFQIVATRSPVSSGSR